MRIQAALLERAWDTGWIDPLNKVKTKPKPKISTLDDGRVPDISVKSMAAHAKTFGNLHKQAIQNYKQNSDYLNIPLRRAKGGAPKFHKPDEDYDEAKDHEALLHVTSHKQPAHLRTYRGNLMSKDLPVGQKFTDHGYSGTSFDRETAADFGNNDREGRERIFAIHSPKGTKSFHFDQDGRSRQGDGERELVLHPHTHYEVLGHSTDNNYGDYHVTHLGVIGQGLTKAGKPDLSLSKNPENKKWLASKKAEFGGRK